MRKSSHSFAAALTVIALIAALVVSALGMVDFMFFLKNKFVFILELLGTGILVPLVEWPGAILKCSVIALSALVFIGLMVFNGKWRNYFFARPLLFSGLHSCVPSYLPQSLCLMSSI